MHYLDQIAMRKPMARKIEDQSQKLLANIKKNQRRIDKAKKLINGVETENNALLYAETRAKILRWEQVINRNLMLLRQRNAEKQKVDEREETKFKRAQQEMRNEIVRLENGKVEEKKATHQFAHANDPKRKLGEVAGTTKSNKKTVLVKAKGFSKNNPVFDETTEQELKNKFLNNLHNQKEKKTRQKKVQDVTKKKSRVRNYGSKGYTKTYYG